MSHHATHFALITADLMRFPCRALKKHRHHLGLLISIFYLALVHIYLCLKGASKMVLSARPYGKRAAPPGSSHPLAALVGLGGLGLPAHSRDSFGEGARPVCRVKNPPLFLPTHHPSAQCALVILNTFVFELPTPTISAQMLIGAHRRGAGGLVHPYTPVLYPPSPSQLIGAH